MLESLFGNKNVQNILLYLCVNGKCYGSELARQFQMPLTPIQNALGRLEKGEIIVSFFEGKTKLYQFNPSYMLLKELEQLLTKTISLLSAQDKKLLQAVSYQKHTSDGKALLAVWDALKSVTQLTFVAKTKSDDGGGWNGRGTGSVQVVSVDNALIFYEKGSWIDPEGHEFDFSNVYRWRLDRQAKVISLEHLRRGIDNPVFLFHLAVDGSNSLSSLDSHLCAQDAYFGSVVFDARSLKVKWRVLGPKKNEEIQTYYTS
ncbi:MAG: winged helix-turn-helix domain-containing protein [Chlamydiales bacterium]|nr:winged helix-turn-helix domain-containing protein [Chlamydiales bacterium]